MKESEYQNPTSHLTRFQLFALIINQRNLRLAAIGVATIVTDLALFRLLNRLGVAV